MAESKSAIAAFRAVAARTVQRAFSAVVWFVLLAMAGVGLLVAGVYVLVGLGFAMVTGGALCAFLAIILLIGMSRGG